MVTVTALPKTVEDAVRVLLTLMPETEQAKVAQVREEDLEHLHLGMGIWIRNNLGLWSSNEELMADTGAHDARWSGGGDHEDVLAARARRATRHTEVELQEGALA